MKRIIFFISVVSFFSCTTLSNATFKDAADWIPADFNPANGILLVQTFPTSKKNNTEMEAYLAKNYKGRYEVFEKETIYQSSGKYADTKNYPFAFVWGSQSEIRHPGVYAGDWNGNFYDRMKKKEYPTTKNYNNYASMAYMPFFNSIIKHFKM